MCSSDLLHSATVDESMSLGDAKIAGRAVPVDDPSTLRRLTHDVSEEQAEQMAEESHLFRVDITEVVLTKIGDPADHLVIGSWHPGRGVQRRERR